MPATITEPSRDIPIAAEVDLAVAGGSCTGVFAAVAAARMGLSVALVEMQGMFGGVATAGLVNIWHSVMDTAYEQQIIGGLTTEAVERLEARDGVIRRDRSADTGFVLNTAELQIVLDEMVTEEEIRPFLLARCVATVGEPGHPEAIVIEDKSGRRAIRAKMFIDATGDGDLLRAAGLSLAKPDHLQPATLCAHIAGLDAVTAANPEVNVRSLPFDDDREDRLNQGFCWWAGVPGLDDVRMVAGTRAWGMDCADGDDLTAAMIEGRRQIRVMLDAWQELTQGDRIRLAGLPAIIGVRQTRQARCLHQLTESEVLHGVRFDDAIANGTYRVDVHHADRPGLTFRYLDGREEVVISGQPRQPGRWRPEQDEDPLFYQIPYRSMVPEGSSNVLAAGRLIDADQGAFGAIRVMVNTNQTGQAAGVAAALACQAQTGADAVQPAHLREELAKQGAIIL